MNLDSAVEHALDGNAVLFVGAGFSVGAPNMRSEHLRTGSELAAHLSTLCELPKETGLEDASDEYLRLFGEDALIRELKVEFTATEATDHQVALARLPWKRVYTTNYDNVFELASAKASRPVSVVTLSDELMSIPTDAILTIHLNGFIDRLDRNTVSSEIKLTETSYLTSSIANSPWAGFFRRDLKSARAVFFIGYAATDLDVRRLLFEGKDLKNKAFFIVGKHPSAVTMRRAKKFGTVVPMDAEELSDHIQEKATGYQPKSDLGPVLYGIEAYKPPSGGVGVRDADVFDLLMRGEARPDLVATSYDEASTYYLVRPEVERTVKMMRDPGSVVVVHSDLGNGKTLVVEGIKYRATLEGYTVYSLEHESFEIVAELDRIAASTSKSMLVIEDYPDWFDELRQVLPIRNKNLSIVLTSRSSPHDSFVSRLQELVPEERLVEIPVDVLGREEIRSVISFLDLYGLWGKDAGLSDHDKLGIVQHRCRSQISSILLYVLQSPQMIARLQSLLDQLNDRRDFYESLIAILVLAVTLHRPSLSMLIDIYGEEVLATSFQHNQIVRQLVDFDSSEIRMRSSVVAKFILRQIADPNITIKVLSQMMRVADHHARMSTMHEDMAKRLMRFSQVQSVLSERGTEEAVYAYYESIKNVNMARGNPFFWLQYAIAATVYEDFERAETYFDTAYSYASSLRWFNTFQIDNHKARFLLRRAIRTGDVDSAMTSFRKARAVVNRQVTEKERFHYPYKVAGEYAEFYDTFAPDLSAKHRAEIFRAARFIETRISQLPDRQARQRDVVECAHNMEYLRLRAAEENIAFE